MGWLSELLLESPVPPSSWMPNDTERRAQARLVIERMGKPERTTHPSLKPHYLRDTGWAYPFNSATRVVSADEIEDDLAESLRRLNPPVIQGWAAGLAGLTVLAQVLAIPAATGTAPDAPMGLAMLLLAPFAWLALVLLAGLLETEIVLGRDRVALRSWTQAWLRRPGRALGDPATLRARIGPGRIRFSGPATSAGVSLRLWPTSAQRTLADDLRAWGVGGTQGRRRRRHHGGRRPEWPPRARTGGAASDAPASTSER